MLERVVLKIIDVVFYFEDIQRDEEVYFLFFEKVEINMNILGFLLKSQGDDVRGDYENCYYYI